MSTTLKRAAAGYDLEFRRELAARLITTITTASMLADDAKIIAFRPRETLDALADAMAAMLAMVPEMDDPAALRKAAGNLAERLRRDVAEARAEGLTAWVGGAPGGTA